MRQKILLISILVALFSGCSKDEDSGLSWEGDAICGVGPIQDFGPSSNGRLYVRYFIHMSWGWMEVDVQSSWRGNNAFSALDWLEEGEQNLCNNKVHNIRITGFEYGQSYFNVNKTPGATFESVGGEVGTAEVVIRVDKKDWDGYINGDLTALRYSVVNYKTYYD